MDATADLETRTSVLQEAETLINGPRRDDYGDVRWSFEAVAKGWTEIIKAPVTAEQVALCMVWLKVMREVNAPKRDNLVDIAGYTGLVEKLGAGQ